MILGQRGISWLVLNERDIGDCSEDVSQLQDSIYENTLKTTPGLYGLCYTLDIHINSEYFLVISTIYADRLKQVICLFS